MLFKCVELFYFEVFYSMLCLSSPAFLSPVCLLAARTPSESCCTHREHCETGKPSGAVTKTTEAKGKTHTQRETVKIQSFNLFDDKTAK